MTMCLGFIPSTKTGLKKHVACARHMGCGLEQNQNSPCLQGARCLVWERQVLTRNYTKHYLTIAVITVVFIEIQFIYDKIYHYF